MTKKLIGSLLAVIMMICGYFYASPYLVLSSLRNAAQAGDSEKVSAYIDYTSVRQSFKDQMNASMVKQMASKQTDGWEALGAMMATTMVDKIVDAVVTPEGMTMMMQGKDIKQSLTVDPAEQLESKSADSKVNYSTRYLSINMFEVTLKNIETNKDIKIIMERDGLSWNVKKFVFQLEDNVLTQSEKKAEPAEHQPNKELQPNMELQPNVEIAPKLTQKQQVAFDFSGVQKGAQLESCYHDPCSIGRVMAFKQLSQTPTESKIELSLVGGSRGWEAKKIEWNHAAHKIQIQCSITKPIIQMDDQITVIPLNDLGVPGVLWSDATLYMQACHNYTDDMDKGIRKYGYNVQDEE